MIIAKGKLICSDILIGFSKVHVSWIESLFQLYHFVLYCVKCLQPFWCKIVLKEKTNDKSLS